MLPELVPESEFRWVLPPSFYNYIIGRFREDHWMPAVEYIQDRYYDTRNLVSLEHDMIFRTRLVYPNTKREKSSLETPIKFEFKGKRQKGGIKGDASRNVLNKNSFANQVALEQWEKRLEKAENVRHKEHKNYVRRMDFFRCRELWTTTQSDDEGSYLVRAECDYILEYKLSEQVGLAIPHTTNRIKPFISLEVEFTRHDDLEHKLGRDPVKEKNRANAVAIQVGLPDEMRDNTSYYQIMLAHALTIWKDLPDISLTPRFRRILSALDLKRYLHSL